MSLAIFTTITSRLCFSGLLVDPELSEGLALASSIYYMIQYFSTSALLCILHDVLLGRGRSGGCSAPVALFFPLTVLLRITFDLLLLSQRIHIYIPVETFRI